MLGRIVRFCICVAVGGRAPCTDNRVYGLLSAFWANYDPLHVTCPCNRNKALVAERLARNFWSDTARITECDANADRHVSPSLRRNVAERLRGIVADGNMCLLFERIDQTSHTAFFGQLRANAFTHFGECVLARFV